MSKERIYTDITGDELKNIIDYLNEFRNDITSGRITQLPICMENKGKGLIIKLEIKNNE